ncbi:hypothetical protein, partial [Halalkalibacter lacteus]|uniref:hypothetical protein n=1 Tax=Halalkalibacter lacteus TaxID=3090663 RepID=UPI002FC91709
REEAGRKGGEETARKYDRKHFEEIGQKGGRISSGNQNTSSSDNNNNNSSGTMTREEAGRKGGEETARKYDRKHFEEIGKKGGRTSSGNQ